MKNLVPETISLHFFPFLFWLELPRVHVNGSDINTMWKQFMNQIKPKTSPLAFFYAMCEHGLMTFIFSTTWDLISQGCVNGNLGALPLSLSIADNFSIAYPTFNGWRRENTPAKWSPHNCRCLFSMYFSSLKTCQNIFFFSVLPPSRTFFPGPQYVWGTLTNHPKLND